ncbi:hypothetical protein [Aquaspirillum serpens]|uniref:hypothetical protein n=1 Tax=Aquaspirillum serpens TaxID=190 RepID=UPI0003B3725B|nr:hypothetical protein [Aquaspirillum serpens]
MKPNTEAFYQKAAIALTEKLNALLLELDPNTSPRQPNDYDADADLLDVSSADLGKQPAAPSHAWKLCFVLVQKIKDVRAEIDQAKLAENDAVLLLEEHLSAVLDSQEVAALASLLSGAAVKPSATPVEEMASLVSETPDVVEAPAVEDNAMVETEAVAAAEVETETESVASDDLPVEAAADEVIAPEFPVAFDNEDAVVATDSALLDSQEVAAMLQAAGEMPTPAPETSAVEAFLAAADEITATAQASAAPVADTADEAFPDLGLAQQEPVAVEATPEEIAALVQAEGLVNAKPVSEFEADLQEDMTAMAAVATTESDPTVAGESVDLEFTAAAPRV